MLLCVTTSACENTAMLYLPSLSGPRSSPYPQAPVSHVKLMVSSPPIVFFGVIRGIKDAGLIKGLEGI